MGEKMVVGEADWRLPRWDDKRDWDGNYEGEHLTLSKYTTDRVRSNGNEGDEEVNGEAIINIVEFFLVHVQQGASSHCTRP